jgi:urease accessory protein
MTRIFAAFGLLALLTTPALAHVGVGDVHDFSSGVLHPFSGLDHMLAAFAVGLWAVLAGPRSLIVWPLTFVTVMAAATLLGAAGFHLPFIEPAIAGSVLALGLLIVLAVRAGPWVGVALIAVFAFVHGHAHGVEGGAALPYLLGLIAATVILHGLGILTGRVATSINAPLLTRGAGGLIAAAGLLLLIG